MHCLRILKIINTFKGCADDSNFEVVGETSFQID